MPDDHTSSPDPAPPGDVEEARPETRIAVKRVRVLLPLPLSAALDYLVPQGFDPPETGSFVRVPLGRRSVVGVVWDGAGDELPAERLKPVFEILPTPKLQREFCRFVERVAVYTITATAAIYTLSLHDALPNTAYAGCR